MNEANVDKNWQMWSGNPRFKRRSNLNDIARTLVSKIEILLPAPTNQVITESHTEQVRKSDVGWYDPYRHRQIQEFALKKYTDQVLGLLNYTRFSRI